MSNYNVFSLFYDDFTRDVKYFQRAKYILSLFDKFDKRPNLMLDLACGTGNFSTEFSKHGIDVIGVDASEDMLSIANEKNQSLDNPVMYICQRAEELELYGTVDGAVCMLDSLNHIIEYDNFVSAISKVAMYLELDRLFIFDLNTPYKHKQVLGNNCFFTVHRDMKCFWKNSLQDDDLTVKITLDFVKGGIFSKKSVYSEEFYERAYTDEEVENALKICGLELLAVYGENTYEPPKAGSERNIYITRRIDDGKLNKMYNL